MFQEIIFLVHNRFFWLDLHTEQGIKKMHFYKIIMATLILTGCNSVYLKPGTLDKGATLYSTRGGYTMRPAVKQAMTERGYVIKIGKIKDTSDILETNGLDGEIAEIPSDARYLLKVSENSEKFRPIFCAFNGFWWWRFYVSIVDQESKEEILTWTGRGCANSSVRLMNKILDDLEK